MENVKLFSGYEKIKQDSVLNPLLVPVDGEEILEYNKHGLKCILRSCGNLIIMDKLNGISYIGKDVEKLNDKILSGEILLHQYLYTNSPYKVTVKNEIRLMIYDQDNILIHERTVRDISTDINDIRNHIDGILEHGLNMDIEYLNGKMLKDIIVDDSCIDFIINDNCKVRMNHEQDCCENVYIEDICGDIKDLIGTKILSAYVSSNSMDEDEKNLKETDCSATWTFYSIATINGFVNIRWIGTSNGYYSEYVDVALIFGEGK